jgi:hypothetical protein
VLDGQGIPYYAGRATGVQGADTTDAVKRFQADAGLGVDGDPGPNTRKALFGAYMDWLCTPGDDSSTTPFRMQPSDFLGGAGAQPGDLPKMSLQSCGKFNPIVLLTTDEMSGDDTTQRNADDAPNRRVIMFFFEKGTTVDPSLWPCPAVKESNDACQSAFWPDAEQRRQNGSTLRLYKDTRDTMACRFYDRFARRSPCEGSKTAIVVMLVDEYETPIMGVPLTLAAEGYQQTGVTDSTGCVRFNGAPKSGLTLLTSDLATLSTALAPLLAKVPRGEAYPTDAGWTVTTPAQLAQPVALQETKVQRVMVVARTDVMFDVPPGWQGLAPTDAGPWQLTQNGERATLALVSQGLGRSVTLECPGAVGADPGSPAAEPTTFATLDVDALHGALFTKNNDRVWQTLSELPREPRDDGPGLTQADHEEIAAACLAAQQSQSVAA